jgi:hypothetical protein
MDGTPMTERTQRLLIAGVCFVGFALSLRAFFDAAAFYSDFRQVLGVGVHSIPREELIYSAWFMFLGSLAAIALAVGLHHTSIPDKLKTAFLFLHARTRTALVALTLAVFAIVACLRWFVLLDAPVADDESTYLFIAQTLQHGRLVNPLPDDWHFFTNQFVVMNQRGWFGKYPIGHPLMLAIADLLGGRALFGPAITSLSLLLTYLVGKKMFGAKTGLLATLLLAVSPHFLLTGATLLSQTTSTLFLLLGLYFLAAFIERRQTAAGALAAACFAYGALVRPFPGALFFLAAFAVLVLEPDGTAFLPRLKANGRCLLLFVGLAALAGLALLLVNQAQTGHVLRNAYHEVHGPRMGVIDPNEGRRSMSMAAALFRQNFWLFGWPVSLLFVWFVRRNRYLVLLAAMVIAEYAYRVVFPKTVVSATGPIYVTEIVPLLALASASGMAELKRRLEGLGSGRAHSPIVSAVSALTVVALLEFWPGHLAALSRGAHAWRYPFEILEAEHVRKALVFADSMVNVTGGATWAYFPPNPTPSQHDDILFVRIPHGDKDPTPAMRQFHRRHFPDRPAFVMRLDSQNEPFTALWPPSGWLPSNDAPTNLAP